MEVKIDKSFKKDVNRIKDKAILNIIASSIIKIQKAESIDQIKNFKKLKGTTNLYRIRIRDYRLGIIVSKTSIEFIRCLHRKDIYKYFPK